LPVCSKTAERTRGAFFSISAMEYGFMFNIFLKFFEILLIKNFSE
jgi:hypothetical protein